MPTVLTAKDIQKGKKGEFKTSMLMQPLQFLPLEEKEDLWTAQNMDWGEFRGIQQIWEKAPRFAKNFELSKGIIDRSDYIPSVANENRDIFDNLLQPGEDIAQDLKPYCFIPSFIDTMRTEFSKRTSKLQYVTADEFSTNEMLAFKQEEINQVLLREAEQRMLEQLIEAGHDPDNPEEQELFQQQLSPENLKSLPEIQEYFNKSYRSAAQEWADIQHKEDVYRFKLDEMEERQFTNMLCVDECYFHFLMKEDDYEIEMWNPMFTYVFKAPETRYTSEAFGAGNIKLMTIPEVLNNYGHIMTESQQKTLERIYPQSNIGYGITGYSPDSYYDNTQSKEWNEAPPGIAMRQVSSVVGANGYGDALTRLMNPNDNINSNGPYLIRVTTNYWKSMRRVGHLTKVCDSGEVIIKVVDESYKVTDHPIYNNQLIDNRVPETLVFGEHIDWIWIPQTWGGVKIGPNIPTYWSFSSPTSGLQPMYLGINQNKIGPLKYQFKGEKTLYGCKIPVEGATFSDYNTRSISAVERLKPYEISFNVVNNQINDILIDELGTVVAIDPNQLPKESLGEDWGKGNYAKAYVAMKNFNILPLDKSLQNTEAAGSSQGEPRVLDLSQTQRLLAKIQLAVYFKNEGLATVGITPQRLGQYVGRQTATGEEQNLDASFAQTEMFFTNFSNNLMPRVHTMRTDLAQFYNSTKPSIRLNYLTSNNEKINFQLNGRDLLLRDFNIHCSSNPTNRRIVEELRKLLITNNTAGGTIYELGALLTADSLGEMNNILKGIEKKSQQQKEREYQEAQKLQQQQLDMKMKEQQLLLDKQALEKEKDRRANILIAEIRAAGYSGSVDLNENQQNDYLDNLDRIQNQTEYQDTMNFEREKETNRAGLAREAANLKREDMNNKLRIKEMDLAIARTNTTASEIAAKKKADKKQQEKKAKK